MKTFTEFMEAISYRKKHKGAVKKMKASDKRDIKIRDKKKKQLGIDAGGKYKLKDTLFVLLERDLLGLFKVY